jgi:hypothetical protein
MYLYSINICLYLNIYILRIIFFVTIFIPLTSRGFNYRIKLFTYPISLYDTHVCDEDLLGITNNFIFFLRVRDVTQYPILQL